MVRQLTIDDYSVGVKKIVSQITPFKVGSLVKVVAPKPSEDSEAFYYLRDFKGAGEIVKTVFRPSWQYHVNFNGQIAIVYHHEIESL